MKSIPNIDKSKLLGFDSLGEPLFDIIQSSDDPSSATRAAGSAKNGGVSKVPGNVKA